VKNDGLNIYFSTQSQKNSRMAGLDGKVWCDQGMISVPVEPALILADHQRGLTQEVGSGANLTGLTTLTENNVASD
jgi:hypothetical protein